MIIRSGLEKDIESCADILMNTEIGRTYYPNKKIMKHKMKLGHKNDCFYVSENEKNEVTGFVWFTLKGAFASYPYLHIISVSEKYRNNGVGKSLLKFYEQFSVNELKAYSTKSYLVTADFNEIAYKFYISNGYRQIGSIDSLFRKGIGERLMYKEICREETE